jgi:predicted DNA-binding protein YlxM (UPF0122 family)
MKDEIELILKLIDMLGEERIFKVYAVLGSREISFGTLVRFIKRKRIVRDLSGKLSVKEISKKHGVSRMTIYNILKKSIR